MRNEQMPDYCLEAFRVRRNSLRVDSRNGYAAARDLRRISAVPADYTADGRLHLARVFERPNEVGADISS